MSSQHATTIYREIEVEVHYTITPGCPPSREHPGDPEEIEIDSARFNGMHVELTDKEIASILADHAEDNVPDPDDARDREFADRILGAA